MSDFRDYPPKKLSRKKLKDMPLTERLVELASIEMGDLSRDLGGVIPMALVQASMEIERLMQEDPSRMTPRAEGYAAFGCGVSIDKAPVYHSSRGRQEWQDGWREAFWIVNKAKGIASK
jgi:ribosome modulation factor